MFFGETISMDRKDRINAKKRGREKDYIKAIVMAKRTKEFDDVKSKIKGVYLENVLF